MNNFSYTRASSSGDAVSQAANAVAAKFLGGGTNLVDLMRENIERPDHLIDVSALPLREIQEHADGSITIGAAARNSAVADHASVRRRFPLLSRAIVSGASGQIRNMATVAGNLMQRTRCCYFYDQAAACNKRAPGSGCGAVGGFNRMHAILGASDHCIATHPSDMCVALAALDATVDVESHRGSRTIPFSEFHRLPGDTPHLDTQLQPDELITSVAIPALDAARHSLYRKVRDRSSYAFGLVSVAAILHVERATTRTVRIALGGVAHKPWRAYAAEETLQGGQADDQMFRRAADAALAGAQGRTYNAFKIELAKRLIVSTLSELARTQEAR
jgi:xanthine dehydrogenase YagS FAD-binding subunit